MRLSVHSYSTFFYSFPAYRQEEVCVWRGGFIIMGFWECLFGRLIYEHTLISLLIIRFSYSAIRANHRFSTLFRKRTGTCFTATSVLLNLVNQTRHVLCPAFASFILHWSYKITVANK